MKKHNIFVVLMIVVLMAVSLPAFAQKGDIELKIVSEKEILVVNKKGQKEVKRVPTATVIPGDEVIYTITYTNNGKEPAESIVISNMIPEQMTYKAGSASGKNATVTFSIDRGKTYKVPQNLKVKGPDGRERPAEASEYTNIRWEVVGKIDPGKSGSVEYRAKLK